MTFLLIVLVFAAAITWVVIESKLKAKKEYEKSGYKVNYKANFYRICRREGITHVDDLTNQMRVQKIAKNHNEYAIWGGRIEAATRLYRAGQKIDQKEKAKERYYQYYPEYTRQKEAAEVLGVEKYLGRAKQDLYLYGTLRVPTTTEREKSVKGAALMGSALFGQAYGTAAAMETQRKNQELRERKEKDWQRWKDNFHSNYTNVQRCLHYDLSKSELEAKIAAVRCRFYDDSQPKSWVSSLNFFNMSCSVTEQNFIRVSGCVTVKKTLMLADKPAVLDGSIKFKIFDESNNYIGDAYYSAPGKDDLSMENIGFPAAYNINAICVPPKSVKIKASQKYRMEIVPHHLWLIEAGSNGPCPKK